MNWLLWVYSVYSTYSREETLYVQNLAYETDLCLSGGSDFHGANKPGLDLGCGYGHLSVPYDFLDRLRERRKHYEY